MMNHHPAVLLICLTVLVGYSNTVLAQPPAGRVYVSGGMSIPTDEFDSIGGASGTGFVVSGRVDVSTLKTANLRLGIAVTYDRWGADVFSSEPGVQLDGYWRAFNLDGQIRFLTSPTNASVSGVLFAGLGISYLQLKSKIRSIGVSIDGKSTVDSSPSLTFGAAVQTSGVFVEGSYRYVFSEEKTVETEALDHVVEEQFGYDAKWFELRIGYSWQLLD